LGPETKKEEKTMKKQFGKLSKIERTKIETQFHKMSAQDFDERMSRAKRRNPGAVRLPSKLVEILRSLAESEGEPEYQIMVKRWIEERLQQETSITR
jgi:hypothetical protein